MAISNTPKPAYIYKDGTWYPISSPVNTAANYDWTGEHVFKNAVTFEDVLRAEGGVNNFQNPAERDTYIQTPANGTVVFIRQDALGNTVNQIQYYQSGSWINHNNIRIDEKTNSYTIGTHDVDKLIKVNSSSNLEVIIPNDATTNFPIGSRVEIGRYGTGEVTIATPVGSGVTIRSVQNIYAIPYQYASAVVTKIAANEWWVFFSSFIGVTTTTTSTTISTTASTTAAPTTDSTAAPTTESTSETTENTPSPSPTPTVSTGIWYTYCGNVAAGYPPGTVIGPVYEEGGNCQTRFDQLTALNEIGSGWNCAPGNATTPSVAPADCGTVTTTTTSSSTTTTSSSTTTTAAPVWYCAAIDCSAPGGPEEYFFQSPTDQSGGCIACSQTSTPTTPSTSCCTTTAAPTTTTAAPTTTTAAPTTTTAAPETTTAAPTTTTAAPTTTTTAAPVGCTTPEPYPGECYCDNGVWMC